jgi:maleate isomerase
MSARVGLVVPSSNTVAEVDFYRHLPATTSLHTARMYLEEVTPEAEAEMLDEHLPIALTDLGTTRPEVVVFASTSAGTLRGNAWEEELVRRIGEHTGATAISVAASVRRAIAARRVRRVGVITPYVDAVNAKIRNSLEEDGLPVAAIHGMGIVANLEIGAIEPERIVQFARERFRGTDIDLLFASCTNFRAFEARGRIERALEVPVVTSNQASLAAALEHIGSATSAAGGHASL